MKDQVREVLSVIQIILLFAILIYLIDISDSLQNPAWMKLLASWAG